MRIKIWKSGQIHRVLSRDFQIIFFYRWVTASTPCRERGLKAAKRFRLKTLAGRGETTITDNRSPMPCLSPYSPVIVSESRL